MSWAGPIINDTGGMGGLTVLHQTAPPAHLQSVTRSAQRCSCDPRYRHSRHGGVSCEHWPGSCQPRQGRKAFSQRVQPPPGQSSSITRYQSRHKRCHGDLRHSHVQREPLGFFVAGVDLRWRLVGACTVGSTPNPRPSCSCNKNVSVPSSPDAGQLPASRARTHECQFSSSACASQNHLLQVGQSTVAVTRLIIGRHP